MYFILSLTPLVQYHFALASFFIMISNTPKNLFKKSLQAGEKQIGVWSAMGNPVSAEICAGSGFDFVVIDAEHGPQHAESLIGQLQAIAGYPDCGEIIRAPSSDAAELRQILDAGARSILVPMVDTAEEAAAIVEACQFPPDGARGLGSSRAARWGRYRDYFHRANEELCIMVQLETVVAMTNLEAIAAVEGVDAVFIGPADLAASMGYIGKPLDPPVRAAVEDGVRRIVAAGKPAGSMVLDNNFASELLAIGASFVAVAIDTRMLFEGLNLALKDMRSLMSAVNNKN